MGEVADYYSEKWDNEEEAWIIELPTEKKPMPKYIEVLDRDIEMLTDIKNNLIYKGYATSYLNALIARMEQAIVHETIAPAKLTGEAYINQTEVWHSRDKGTMRIADMHPKHAQNACDWAVANIVAFNNLNSMRWGAYVQDTVVGMLVLSPLYKALQKRSREAE